MTQECERHIHTHEVAGSSPAPPTTKSPLDLATIIREFVLSRRIAGCSPLTISGYEYVLTRFRSSGGDPLRYLDGLRQRMKPSSVHVHFRCLRTFFRWAVEGGLIGRNPLINVRMKLPRTLPRVPEDAEVKALIAACIDDFSGTRNRALVSLLADSALRITEAVNLRVGDVDFDSRTLRVKGKGGIDGVGHFGTATAEALRAWLKRRKPDGPDDLLFVTREERPLDRYLGARILARLSVKAGLHKAIRPHALRRYAATSLLRRTGDLELTRQVLRHSTLTMTLRYARLTQTDVGRKFAEASPLDHLG